jgi:hypothetical protein
MAREIWQILKDKKWNKENLAEARNALAEVTKFANDDLYRSFSVRASVETLDSLRLLRDSIDRFDNASGKMITRGNRINIGVLIFAVVAALLAAGALWVSWLSYQLTLGQVGR